MNEPVVDKELDELLVEVLRPEKKTNPFSGHKRNKRANTPDFNRKAKKRRAKAKHDAKARKTNRKK